MNIKSRIKKLFREALKEHSSGEFLIIHADYVEYDEEYSPYKENIGADQNGDELRYIKLADGDTLEEAFIEFSRKQAQLSLVQLDDNHWVLKRES